MHYHVSTIKVQFDEKETVSLYSSSPKKHFNMSSESEHTTLLPNCQLAAAHRHIFVKLRHLIEANHTHSAVLRS